MKLGVVLVLTIGVFALGWVVSDYYDDFGKEQPFAVSGLEISSPNDRITKEHIRIYNNSILLKIENATIAGFTNTNSMDPVIDEDANSIEIKPDKLKIGDIVSYYKDNKKIIHRIIHIDEDEQGIYYIMKGDNNNHPDRYKVRFDDIAGVVVGVLY